ncbi:MAG TPA: penicillin-binding transpeptidase domain-containing protein [Bryobacteraceae bacterium]|nr:penicillin-binding transpeptidase domain-containing protein [Bryobacteraceae bacterium]
MMRENNYIDDREYAVASAEPLVIARAGSESTDAPYFVDLVNSLLLDKFAEHDFQTNSYRVYTSLDLQLQKDAAEAVRIGIKEVDEQLRKKAKKGTVPKEAQVALVAMDPQTGEIKALIGGRDYGQSQLNRAEAKRQPGSAFKPFVYAAALNTALSGGPMVFTPATILDDEPTTFWYDNKAYTPANHRGAYYGQVTLRQAIAKSLNIPTVRLAEETGYRSVVDLARRAGLNMEIRPTPAVALGAYEVTPVEVAGAYTMFANRGIASRPMFIKHIRSANGVSIYDASPERRTVLDPRVSYLMVSLMEEVMRSGTAAGTRARGFVLPASLRPRTVRQRSRKSSSPALSPLSYATCIRLVRHK